MLEGKYGEKYYEDFYTFDIETTRLKIDGNDEAIIYSWQLCIEGGVICTGRNIRSFIRLLKYISSHVLEGRRIIIYVFNLAYEFQFLRSYLDFNSEDVFCIKNRAILYARYERIEFRCAYRLTNMSLDYFLKVMDVEHKKLSGVEFNYDVIRYPWTALTEKEKQYAINDVLGLYEGIHKLMINEGDSPDTIPLTSTGYVRRTLKKAMRSQTYILSKAFPDINLFTMLRKAFRGGDTHASRYYAGIMLENVSSCDRASSYIEVLFNYKYPYVFKKYNNITYSLLCNIMERGKYACLFTVILKNISIKKEVSSPYISFSKTEICADAVKDNGRVLQASFIKMVITDVDWEIIRETYNWDSIEVGDCYISSYRNLPSCLLDVVKGLYKRKCEIKGSGDDTAYILSKERLNSVYGDMVQNILKDVILYAGKSEDPYELREMTNEEYIRKGKYPYKLYQWGVWVTAYARRELYYLSKKIGLDFVYSDTDSIKYCGDHDNDIAEYNRRKKAQDEKNGAFCDVIKGGRNKRYFLGVYEKEEVSNKFITFGAKKYIVEDEKTDVTVTISGVDKVQGSKEVMAYGGIENVKEGFVFKKGGGARVVYNDDTTIKKISVDGHTLEYASNAVIMPDEYTLHIDNDYTRLLKLSRETLRELLNNVGEQVEAERSLKNENVI